MSLEYYGLSANKENILGFFFCKFIAKAVKGKTLFYFKMDTDKTKIHRFVVMVPHRYIPSQELNVKMGPN